MNARQAIEVDQEMILDLFVSAKKLAEHKGISINEAIDYKVSVYEKYARNANEATAWYLRGIKAKEMITV